MLLHSKLKFVIMAIFTDYDRYNHFIHWKSQHLQVVYNFPEKKTAGIQSNAMRFLDCAGYLLPCEEWSKIEFAANAGDLSLASPTKVWPQTPPWDKKANIFQSWDQLVHTYPWGAASVSYLISCTLVREFKNLIFSPLFGSLFLRGFQAS